MLSHLYNFSTDIALELMHVESPISPGLFRIVRVVRIARLLRSIQHLRGIRQLIFTAIKSAPALGNVCLILFLIIFIYAVLGMTIFQNVRFNKDLNKVVNFQTFWSSVGVLFRISTAAGWNLVLNATMTEEPPTCNPNLVFKGQENGITKGDCGNKMVAIIFFVSYIMLLSWIIVNVYIAVMLENFRQAQAQETIGITEDGIEAFYDVWQMFDPVPTQFIQVADLPEFVEHLEEPFNLTKLEYEEMLTKCDIAVKERERFHCLDVLSALVKFRLGDRRCSENENMKKVLEKVEQIFAIKFPVRKQVATIDSTLKRHLIKVGAAQTIQRVFRYYCYVTYLKNITRMVRYNKNPKRYLLRDMRANLVMPKEWFDENGFKRDILESPGSQKGTVYRNNFSNR